MTGPTPNPLYAASHMQNMARNAGDSRFATAMTVMSVSLLGLMLVREARDLLKTDKFDRDEASRRRR